MYDKICPVCKSEIVKSEPSKIYGSDYDEYEWNWSCDCGLYNFYENEG